MSTVTGLGLMLLVLLPVWALLASPLLAAFALTNRYRRRKLPDSVAAVIGIALLFAFLLAPTPTPIITLLVPLGVALLFFDEVFLAAMPSGGIWPWIAISFAFTFLGAFCLMRYGPTLWSSVSNRTRNFIAGGLTLWALASCAFIAVRVAGS